MGPGTPRALTEDMEAPAFVAREETPPLLALVAPALYLAACAGAVWAKTIDPSADVGVQGLLIAVGLVPAFVVPAVFSSRSVLVAVTGEGLLVDGRAIEADDVRVQHGDRGSARVHVETRGGRRRTFVFASAKDAEQLASQLAPISARSLAMSA